MTRPDAVTTAKPGWLEDDPRPLDWNGPTDRPFDRFGDDDLDRPIVELFERVARRLPDRVAVTDGTYALTYAELWERASGLAETVAAGAAPGELVGIRLPACPAFPVAMLACLAAGRPVVALDAHAPRAWLDRVTEDARPALVLANGALPGAVDLDQPVRSASGGWRPTPQGTDDPAFVLFTSGSTGRPKGVVNSQRALLQRVAQSINAAHIGPGDRLLTLASPCTVVGVRDLLTALLAGASVRLLDLQRMGAREILQVVRSEAVSILFAFPGLLRTLVASDPQRAGEALRLVRVGGDTTLWSDIELLRAWLAPGAAIQSIYAATEAPMMQWFVDEDARRDDPRVPIGYPLPGNRLAVVDAEGAGTRPGEVGELVVAGPCVSLGHWTGGRLVREGVEACGTQRMFRTGDLVRRRSDGLLERVGRKDRQVKIRGARVDLDGVEAALRRHPAVRDVGVLARTGGADGAASLIAYVSAGGDPPAGLVEELAELMREAPPPMRPARVYLVREVPRLASSKLDVGALAVLDEARVRDERAGLVAATSGNGDRIARIVAQVWQDVLQVAVERPEDDFFDAGGDSLKSIAFVLELERALGAELPLTLINEAPSFGRLCEALRAPRTEVYVPLVLLKAGDGSPPVFFIHGVGGNVVELVPAARRVAYPGEVIGVQARGLDGRETPRTSVEAMAAEYLEAIRARQPTGPYHLCGYSFGGLVAFELARRLRESGEEVGLVGLFDTMMSPLRWPPRAWLSIVWRRISKVGAVLARRDRPAPPDLLRSAPPAVLKVAASALLASARYRPGFYPGELTLFSPVDREPGLPPLQAIWRSHALALRVVETAGDHATMLSGERAGTAAAALTRCLPWS